MNQDQIQSLLGRLEPQAPEFHVVFTGKSSRKVNGLYKPETREILLHNKNFNSDQELVYAAVQEFAHHLHFCSDQRPAGARSYNSVYWSLFHRLLTKAEQLGLYRNVFVEEPDFQKLTDEIKSKYLAANGQLMKDFGQALLHAVQLCGKHHVRFEDYMDRVLCIPRSTAKTVMASFAQDVTPDFGFDHLKMMTSVKDADVRRDMELKRREGYSTEMLRQELKGEPLPEVVPSPLPDPLEAKVELLERSKEQLQKKIDDWRKKLEELEQKIEALKTGEGDA